MTIDSIIKKWSERYDLHKRVIDDPLMYTKEVRQRAVGAAGALLSILEDLKLLQIQGEPDNVQLSKKHAAEVHNK